MVRVTSGRNADRLAAALDASSVVADAMTGSEVLPVDWEIRDGWEIRVADPVWWAPVRPGDARRVLAIVAALAARGLDPVGVIVEALDRHLPSVLAGGRPPDELDGFAAWFDERAPFWIDAADHSDGPSLRKLVGEWRAGRTEGV